MELRKLLMRYVRFVGTSIVGTLVDTLVLWLLSDYVFTKGYWGEYVVSPVISFQCALAVNFLISYFYVWKDRSHGSPGSVCRRMLILYLEYNLSCSLIFLVRMGILTLIGKFTGWDVVICNLLAVCVSGIVNFTISNLFIFKRKSVG